MSKADLIIKTVGTRRDDECWSWPGAHTSGGYPVVKFQGKSTGVYRVSYELRYGAFPEGYEADHKCHNAWCWNPDHIRPVTHLTNVRMSPNQHSYKTECVNGHLLEEGNIQARTDRRICLTCRRERERRYKLLRSAS